MYTPDVARGKPKCAMSRPARPSKRHDFATPRTGRRPLWFGMRGSRCPGATFAHPFPGGDRSNRVRIVRIVLSPNGSNARRTPRTTERFERSERQMLWSEPVTELDCQDVNEQERGRRRREPEATRSPRLHPELVLWVLRRAAVDERRAWVRTI